jgi:hypothetical protein
MSEFCFITQCYRDEIFFLAIQQLMYSSTLNQAKGLNKWKETRNDENKRDEKGYMYVSVKLRLCAGRRIKRNVHRQQHAFKYLTTNIVIILIFPWLILMK